MDCFDSFSPDNAPGAPQVGSSLCSPSRTSPAYFTLATPKELFVDRRSADGDAGCCVDHGEDLCMDALIEISETQSPSTEGPSLPVTPSAAETCFSPSSLEASYAGLETPSVMVSTHKPLLSGFNAWTTDPTTMTEACPTDGRAGTPFAFPSRFHCISPVRAAEEIAESSSLLEQVEVGRRSTESPNRELLPFFPEAVTEPEVAQVGRETAEFEVLALREELAETQRRAAQQGEALARYAVERQALESICDNLEIDVTRLERRLAAAEANVRGHANFKPCTVEMEPCGTHGALLEAAVLRETVAALEVQILAGQRERDDLRLNVARLEQVLRSAELARKGPKEDVVQAMESSAATSKFVQPMPRRVVTSVLQADIADMSNRTKTDEVSSSSCSTESAVSTCRSVVASSTGDDILSVHDVSFGVHAGAAHETRDDVRTHIPCLFTHHNADGSECPPSSLAIHSMDHSVGHTSPQARTANIFKNGAPSDFETPSSDGRDGCGVQRTDSSEAIWPSSTEAISPVCLRNGFDGSPGNFCGVSFVDRVGRRGVRNSVSSVLDLPLCSDSTAGGVASPQAQIPVGVHCSSLRDMTNRVPRSNDTPIALSSYIASRNTSEMEADVDGTGSSPSPILHEVGYTSIVSRHGHLSCDLHCSTSRLRRDEVRLHGRSRSSPREFSLHACSRMDVCEGYVFDTRIAPTARFSRREVPTFSKRSSSPLGSGASEVGTHGAGASRYSMLRICENLPRGLYEIASSRSRSVGLVLGKPVLGQ